MSNNKKKHNHGQWKLKWCNKSGYCFPDDREQIDHLTDVELVLVFLSSSDIIGFTWVSAFCFSTFFQGVVSWEPSPRAGAPTHQLLPPHHHWYWLSLQPRGLHAEDASKAAPPQLPIMSRITTRHTSFLVTSLSFSLAKISSTTKRRKAWNKPL